MPVLCRLQTITLILCLQPQLPPAAIAEDVSGSGNSGAVTAQGGVSDSQEQQDSDANSRPATSPTTPEARDRDSENKDEQHTVAKLTEQVSDSIVVISTKGRNGEQLGLGTGFVVSPDGLIATCLHVIGEARPIEVRLADGKRYNVESVHATEQATDLAILRINATALSALELGDSDKLKVGERVVALGHPLGFRNSVVSGDVSSRRDFDGVPMFQLAVPIEPGNSGGPLMSLEGKVHGIIAMKSLQKRNLSFAVAINALKPLLTKPNPVSMSRWLTMGALDPKEWVPLFGANWRQRAGRIQVNGMGKGFGGRSLCLAQRQPPQLPYEIAVTVRMKQEDGAAGLVFYSDSDQKHYGFYPSSGRLRLSRFDGADVYSWKVLSEVQTPHYRPGDWNTIKVRLEEKRIQCFINDHPIIESEDVTYSQGELGLAKFRHTEAEFKEFRVGKEIASSRPSLELKERVTELVRDIGTQRPPKTDLIQQVTSPNEPVSLALRERAQLLEKQAERLRQLARIVHQRKVHKQLADLLKKDDAEIDLLHAALLIAYHDNDEIDIGAYQREVKRMITEVSEAITTKDDEATKLAALNRYFFKEIGFHGSRIDYYNRSNSFLNEVIDDREGLPISLSVLYIEMARRLGATVVGVGLPGHFVVRFQPQEGESRLIDVFNSGVEMSQAEAREWVRASFRQRMTEAELEAATKQFLKASTKRQIITRMLRNLFGSTEDQESRLAYAETILVIEPDNLEFRAHRIDLRVRTGRIQEAISDIDWMLEKKPDVLDERRVRAMRQSLMEALQTTDDPSPKN